MSAKYFDVILFKILFFSFLFFLFFTQLALANEISILDYQKISNLQGNLGQTLPSHYQFGTAVEDIGDLDGDGVNDIAVSATGAGHIYILFLNENGSVKNSVKNVIPNVVTGDFGVEIEDIGDLDGDGVNDIAVGAISDGVCPTGDPYCANGAVYIFFLNENGTVKNTQLISNHSGGMEGQLPRREYFGQAIANLGDLNMDGNIELAVSAFDNTYSLALGVGKTYILSLNSSGVVVSNSLITNSMYYSGSRTQSDAKILSLVNLGDLDGDGVNDLVAGMPESSEHGGLRVVFLNSDLTVKSSIKIPNSAFGENLDWDSQIGMSVDVVSDIDGDNIQDLIVGAPLHNFYSDKQGAVWIVNLNIDGSVKSSQRLLRSDFNLPISYDFFGFDLSVLKNTNQNANSFKVVVAASVDDDLAVNSGAVYVLTLGKENVNNLPLFGSIEGQSIAEGMTFNLTVSATDADNDPLTYSASNLPAGASFDPQTQTFSWTPDYDDAGSYEVVFSVTDGELSDTATATIEVLNTNRAPILEPIGNQTVSENQNLTFTLSANDADGDSLTYSAANLPSGATFDPQTRTFSWTPGYNDAGNYTDIEFTVTDNGSPMELDVELVTITVGDVNRAPEFLSPGAHEVLEGDQLTFSVSASDPDNDTVTLSALGLPSGATFNAQTGEFIWTPTLSQEGIYTVTFTASDSGTPTETGSVDVAITVGDNPTPVEQSEDIIEDVIAIDLPTNVENSYMANLQKVATFITEGKIQAAINQLNAFINKVNQDYAQGILTQQERDDLVDAAEDLIEDID